MYKVLEGFYDLMDFSQTKDGKVYHHYQPGDDYPRDGYKPSTARVMELGTTTNKMGRPLIELPTAEAPAEQAEEKQEVKPKAKRTRKKKAEPVSE